MTLSAGVDSKDLGEGGGRERGYLREILAFAPSHTFLQHKEAVKHTDVGRFPYIIISLRSVRGLQIIRRCISRARQTSKGLRCCAVSLQAQQSLDLRKKDKVKRKKEIV